MKKSHLYITLGVLAVGVAYYFYNKSKNPTKPTVKSANPTPNEKSASTATADEPKSNYVKGDRMGSDCFNGEVWLPCSQYKRK